MKFFVPVLFFLCCCCRHSAAQQGIYIPPGGKVSLTGTVPVTFYFNTQNDGALSSNAGATLYFLGRQWTNGSGGTLPDAGAGGVFRFAGISGRQVIYSGYNLAGRSGATFPNLMIDNAAGVELGDLHDLRVRNDLHFRNGHLFLNGWNLYANAITGFNAQRFIVTGTAAAGGFLYRDINAATVLFPVGTAPGNYAPVSVLNAGTTETFHARVFDGVYQSAISGAALPDTFIQQTWNIGSNGTGSMAVSYAFQHMNAAESTPYAANRLNSFVVRYQGNGWQRQAVQNLLVAEGPETASTLHTQSFPAGVAQNEYFAKGTQQAVEGYEVLFIRFAADRLSPSSVGLLWTTWYEANNSHFEIERRLESETTFSTVGTMPSQGINGNSPRMLEYSTIDPNGYNGWSYYRIKVILRNGAISYTVIRAVPPLKRIDIFPNPNYGQFKVRIYGLQADVKMQITNTWGQVVREYDIEQGSAEAAVHNLAAATYYVSLYYKTTGVLVETRRIIVLK